MEARSLKKLVTTENAVPGDLMTERVDKQGRARLRAASGSTKQLEFLVAISEQLSESRTLGEVVDIVYDGVRSGLGYDRVGIYVLDRAAGTFEDLAGTDDTGNKIIPTDRQLDVGPESNIWSFPGLASTLRGVPYYTEDAVAECPPELLYMYDGAPTHNIMVPLKVGEKVTGMISVDNLTTGRPIYPEEIAQLRSLAAQVSRAVESARLREAQRESDERYRIIFESTSIGIATSDVEGRVLTANPAYQRLVGYDETELIVRPVLTPSEAVLPRRASCKIRRRQWEQYCRCGLQGQARSWKRACCTRQQRCRLLTSWLRTCQTSILVQSASRLATKA
jgi:GAF domain-containing protein